MSEKCGECGAIVDVTPGHPRNWPRLIVANASSIKDAMIQFQASVDEDNAGFAWPEFADAMQDRWGISHG